VYAVISKDTFASNLTGFPFITAGFNFSTTASPAWTVPSPSVINANSAVISGAITGASASISGAVSAAAFSGSGSGLINIPNTALISNTITISGTVVPLGGTYTLPVGVDATNASNITSGTLSPARLPTTGVLPGTYIYPSILVDANGRITQVSSLTPVTQFNNRTGPVTLTASDVTGALTYTPPQPNGTGAYGTWNISIAGSSAVVNTLSASTAVITGGTISGINLSASNATLTSPNLTGTPVAPTPDSNNSSSQVATTQFVHNVASELVSGAVGGLGSMANQNSNRVNITGGSITGVSGITASTANSISNSGGWSVVPSGNKIFFQYNGVNVASIDSSGNFIAAQTITSYSSP
jgi:hypothetical protein